jgi:hypothetical protein
MSLAQQNIRDVTARARVGDVAAREEGDTVVGRVGMAGACDGGAARRGGGRRRGGGVALQGEEGRCRGVIACEE